MTRARTAAALACAITVALVSARAATAEVWQTAATFASRGGEVSTNWAGYATSTARPFASVTGRWVEPEATCGTTATYSAFWVGLGGFSDGSFAVEQTGTFAVSVLERGQEFIAERFAGRAPLVDPGWREVPHSLGPAGLPLVDGCIAWFECELRALHRAGDHDIAVGEVTAAGRRTGEPLVLWDRAFWRLA